MNHMDLSIWAALGRPELGALVPQTRSVAWARARAALKLVVGGQSERTTIRTPGVLW